MSRNWHRRHTRRYIRRHRFNQREWKPRRKRFDYAFAFKFLLIFILLFLLFYYWEDLKILDEIPYISDIKNTILPRAQNISLIEKQTHEFINQQRTNYGLSPLVWDSELSYIARKHSQDMLENDFFDHINLNGEDPTARGNKEGYPCYKDYGSYYTEGLAENIHNVPLGNVMGCGYVYREGEIAECAVSGWMESLGHRENILTMEYDLEGIGVACDSSDCYLTQNFC